MKSAGAGRPLLAAAALLAGLAPWWLARDEGAKSFPGFLVESKIPAAATSPFFQTVQVNAVNNHAKSHSATLAELPDGTLVAAWYAGSGEGAADVAIYLSRRGVDGAWSEPAAVMTRERVQADLRRNVISLGNPLLLPDDSGRLGLLFVSIAAGRWSGSSMNLAWSEDGGLTWGAARKLTMNPLANLSALPRNPPARLVGGGWAVPVYEEFLGKFPETLWLQPRRKDYSAAVSRVEGGVYVLQSALVPLAVDRAVSFFRDFRPARWMSASWSDDAGRTWTKPAVTGLPNRDSGLCAIRLSDGAILMAFNDLSPGKRENLRLALSEDEGRTWRTIATLAEEAGSEFSYPYLIRPSDGTIRMVYSARQTQILFAEFNEAWVYEQAEAAR
ncbi:MAG: exo-alpha-sialidase [Verrucomicrobia bacterium]|nr:exo-alpha-sialidase [Verrucomicrobiota bacterium]MDA1204181.1 exo-alpha-sialidase [Verrucomicrobiota bacterium]